MLCYDRIDVSEGTDVNKTSASEESDIFHYWHLLNYSPKFHPNVCNRCHDLLMMSIKFSDITILNINGSDYLCIVSLISKNDSINLMENADLTEKSRVLKNKKDLFSYEKNWVKKFYDLVILKLKKIIFTTIRLLRHLLP